MSFLNSWDLWVGWSPFSPFGPGNVKPFSKYRLVCCEGGLSNENTDHIWVNYNISLTWIKAIWGWFPLLTMIPVRSQWGRYNLPRSYVIVWHTRYIQIKLQKPFSRPLHPQFGMKSMGSEAGWSLGTKSDDPAVLHRKSCKVLDVSNFLCHITRENVAVRTASFDSLTKGGGERTKIPGCCCSLCYLSTMLRQRNQKHPCWLPNGKSFETRCQGCVFWSAWRMSRPTRIAQYDPHQNQILSNGTRDWEPLQTWYLLQHIPDV